MFDSDNEISGIKWGIDLINVLFENGTLGLMYQKGVIRQSLFLYREIYLWVHNQVDTQGLTKNKAVLEAQFKFGKDEATIWRALRMFEK